MQLSEIFLTTITMTSRKVSNHNLWSDFVNCAVKNLVENGYLLFTNSSSQISPTGKNTDTFYKIYAVVLNINECENYFLSVGSKFSYYLIQKTNEKHKIEVLCMYENKTYRSKL